MASRALTSFPVSFLDVLDGLHDSPIDTVVCRHEGGARHHQTLRGALPTPMVAESPVHFEYKYHSTHRMTGNSNVGTIDIVFAQVERIHINVAVLTLNGRLDIQKIQPLARMGYHDYTSITETFEMKIPRRPTTKLTASQASPPDTPQIPRSPCSPPGQGLRATGPG